MQSHITGSNYSSSTTHYSSMQLVDKRSAHDISRILISNNVVSRLHLMCEKLLTSFLACYHLSLGLNKVSDEIQF